MSDLSDSFWNNTMKPKNFKNNIYNGNERVGRSAENITKEGKPLAVCPKTFQVWGGGGT